MISKFLRKIFTADKWNIGFVHQSKEDFILRRGLSPDLEWIKEDSVEYAADPFVSVINRQVYIFYEELNFWKGKGQLNIIKDLDFGTKRKISGIEPADIHLSYPYIFKSDSSLYCIPETSASKEVGLYLIDAENEMNFKKVRTLISGEHFVDTSMVHYGNKFWLFTSISQRPKQLYIYYSDSLDKQFVPHISNPIPVCSYESRGAGDMFIVDNALYRPTQNPTNRYGGSIMINKVEQLSEEIYRQKFEFEIQPQSPYSKGLHNISFAEDLIVLDGKRTISSVIMPLKKVVKKIRSKR